MKKLNKRALLWSLVITFIDIAVTGIITYGIWLRYTYCNTQVLAVVIFTLLVALYFIICRLIYAKVVKKYNSMDYNYVIKNKWKSIFYPNGLPMKSFFIYMIAMAYLELEKEYMFHSVINKLVAEEEIKLKYYALIIYHSYKEEYDKLPLLKEKYNSSTPIPQLSHFDGMLAIIEKCQNGIEYSESELETVKKVKSNVMKKILSL